ncbi:MAG: hypothetical protein ACRD12_20630 [Acidimicrobiales bacterium]
MNRYGDPTLGLARPGWVLVELHDGRPEAFLVGTGHRRMVVRRVPVRTAATLIARGLPSVVRRVGQAA